MPDSVAQHVVPQVYLKRFADTQSKQIAIARRGLVAGHGLAVRTAPVKKAAVYNDFYTIDGPDGRIEHIEKQLSIFENKFPRVYKALRSPRPLAGEIRSDIVFLATLQHARSLNLRHFALVHYALAGTDGAAEFLETDPSFSDIHKRIWEEKDAAERVKQADKLARIAIPETFEAIFAVLGKMYMCVVESNAHDFFTSDQPVVFFNPTIKDSQVNTYAAYPYHRLPVEVTYPLTKRHCALFSWMPLQQNASASAEVVSGINARTAFCCAREIFTSPYLSPAGKDRFLRDALRSEDAMWKPLLWTYCSLQLGPNSLESALDQEGMDKVAVLKIRVPFWWWRGMPNLPPELAQYLDERQQSDNKSEAGSLPGTPFFRPPPLKLRDA